MALEACESTRVLFLRNKPSVTLIPNASLTPWESGRNVKGAQRLSQTLHFAFRLREWQAGRQRPEAVPYI